MHDKRAADAAFLRSLDIIERESGDGRNFVKKAVNMALRAIGKRNRAPPGPIGRRDGALDRWERTCVSSPVRPCRSGSGTETGATAACDNPPSHGP